MIIQIEVIHAFYKLKLFVTPETSIIVCYKNLSKQFISICFIKFLISGFKIDKKRRSLLSGFFFIIIHQNLFQNF